MIRVKHKTGNEYISECSVCRYAIGKKDCSVGRSQKCPNATVMPTPDFRKLMKLVRACEKNYEQLPDNVKAEVKKLEGKK
jgi:hypothetical protein